MVPCPRVVSYLTLTLAFIAFSAALEPTDAAPPDVKIEGEVDIVPWGVGIRKMLGIVRHPDGSIYGVSCFAPKTPLSMTRCRSL